MYKKIENEANGVKYRDVRVFELNISTNYLQTELMNYSLEEVLKAVENTFNIKLVIKEEE